MAEETKIPDLTLDPDEKKYDFSFVANSKKK